MPTLSAARRTAAAKGHTDALDGGTGPGLIRIYGGSKPADPDAALTGQVLLAEFTLADPAFVDGPQPGHRQLDATPILTTEGVAAGTATWYRALSSDGVAHFDGTVSDQAGAGELKLNTTTVSVGLILELTSGMLTQPS